MKISPVQKTKDLLVRALGGVPYREWVDEHRRYLAKSNELHTAQVNLDDAQSQLGRAPDNSWSRSFSHVDELLQGEKDAAELAGVEWAVVEAAKSALESVQHNFSLINMYGLDLSHDEWQEPVDELHAILTQHPELARLGEEWAREFAEMRDDKLREQQEASVSAQMYGDVPDDELAQRRTSLIDRITTFGSTYQLEEAERQMWVEQRRRIRERQSADRGNDVCAECTKAEQGISL